MSVASGVRLRAIRPQADKTFFKDGKFIVTTGTGDDAEQSTDSEETTLSDVEKNPEKKVSVMKMVGKASPYEIELTGTKKQILKAIDWVAKNEEPMSVVSMKIFMKLIKVKRCSAMTLHGIKNVGIWMDAE